MGSQSWWFGDPRTLLYRVKPLHRRVQWFLGQQHFWPPKKQDFKQPMFRWFLLISSPALDGFSNQVHGDTCQVTWVKCFWGEVSSHLGGGNSNIFEVSPIPGEDSLFWLIFSNGLKPPTSHPFQVWSMKCVSEKSTSSTWESWKFNKLFSAFSKSLWPQVDRLGWW